MEVGEFGDVTLTQDDDGAGLVETASPGATRHLDVLAWNPREESQAVFDSQIKYSKSESIGFRLAKIKHPFTNLPCKPKPKVILTQKTD